MEMNMAKSKQQKLRNEMEHVDHWIQQVLVAKKNQTLTSSSSSAAIDTTSKDDHEVLNTVEQATANLRDGRFSDEHVTKMFNRIIICDETAAHHAAAKKLALLVDAAGKLDQLDRDKIPTNDGAAAWNATCERDSSPWIGALIWKNLHHRKQQEKDL